MYKIKEVKEVKCGMFASITLIFIIKKRRRLKLKKLASQFISFQDSTNDGLEPQARDRSHSDPSKQKEEKREKYHQTQL